MSPDKQNSRVKEKKFFLVVVVLFLIFDFGNYVNKQKKRLTNSMWNVTVMM